jgi:YVTN family beta-propeller protein
MISARRLSLLLSAAALALTPTLTPALSAQAAAEHGPYKILTIDKIGGDGGWDYLTADATTRQLYLARSGPTGNLHVYNLDTLAPLGEVPTGNAHGAAIDDATHHGFATSNPVTMFDTQTLKVIKTINTGGRPDGFLDDPATHHVYILSHVTPNVTVLDAATGDIVKAFDVGGAVEQSVLDNHGHLFLDLEDKDAIAVVDTATYTLTGKYDISKVSGGCAGLAIDAAHDVLFASCSDKKNMVILNATDGKIITVLPTGEGSDGAEFNPDTMEAFSTQGEGTLTIIKSRVTNRSEPTATDFYVEQNLKTQPRARTLTLDQKTGHIITATADFGPAPALQPGQRYARPPMIPNTFRLLVIGK